MPKFNPKERRNGFKLAQSAVIAAKPLDGPRLEAQIRGVEVGFRPFFPLNPLQPHGRYEADVDWSKKRTPISYQ